ncbi:hypothetical protein HYALB_00001684 [Hymenoscyphus albidus]|uniref:Uncharacterized protein n=1 Tax=Hymenoscyphus albidus TaxID=595503 RepID=A0A9N9Q3M6_9HELO|nr:hypothetical protein HYALB_00001684 [Hymenoscyphus albidus]
MQGKNIESIPTFTIMDSDLEQNGEHELDDKWLIAERDWIDPSPEESFLVVGKAYNLMYPRRLYPVKSQEEFDRLYELSNELRIQLAKWEELVVPVIEAKAELKQLEAAAQRQKELLQRDQIRRSVETLKRHYDKALPILSELKASHNAAISELKRKYQFSDELGARNENKTNNKTEADASPPRKRRRPFDDSDVEECL